jgi:hypothetical protein
MLLIDEFLPLDITVKDVL